MSDFPVAVGAGCIALRAARTAREVLVVWTKTFPDPTLPKGKLEPGETPEQGALRELKEETGYVGELVDGVSLVTERLLDRKLPFVRSRVHWFRAAAIDGAASDRIEAELISRVGWLRVEDAVEQMMRPDEIAALRWRWKLDLLGAGSRLAVAAQLATGPDRASPLRAALPLQARRRVLGGSVADPFSRRDVPCDLGQNGAMTRVERLEQEIASLSPEEFAELREWLLERDWEAWDEQIERDAKAGRLDRLVDEAVADDAEGRTTSI